MTGVLCTVYGAQVYFPIGPKHTTLVEDVEILLPVKFRWILFSDFRWEVENISANSQQTFDVSATLEWRLTPTLQEGWIWKFSRRRILVGLVATKNTWFQRLYNVLCLLDIKVKVTRWNAFSPIEAFQGGRCNFHLIDLASSLHARS